MGVVGEGPGNPEAPGAATRHAFVEVYERQFQQAVSMLRLAAELAAAVIRSCQLGTGWRPPKLKPGLGSMLLGRPDVEADTWITRFVHEATGEHYPSDKVRDLVTAAFQELAVTTVALDHAIWDYMRRAT